jgi:hypothetical protein
VKSVSKSVDSFDAHPQPGAILYSFKAIPDKGDKHGQEKGEPLPPYDENSLPGPVRPEAITEELDMMRFVEKETGDEKVLFLEKVKSEQVKVVISGNLVPAGQDRPKMTDFLAWSEHIAGSIAEGPGAEERRSYLKTISKAAWQIVNWLAHAEQATKFDGNMAIQAVEYVLMSFGAALDHHV